jgi:EAL domain-containing protein (putative c-di-GMP-specific phosphodiesterase class I)
MENPNEAAKKLKQLKEVGVQIAMDDFGTEFSSLYYLSKFPIDVIKIDRLFIKDIEYDAKVRTIIRSIVSLAHDLGLKVTAEGVETKKQLAFLKEISCDFAQGFYFSRPKDAKIITEYLLNTPEGIGSKNYSDFPILINT